MDRTPNDLLPASKEDAKSIGSKHYFDGIPCKNGHIEKRRTKCKSCIQCIRNASTKYKLTEKYQIGAAKRIEGKKSLSRKSQVKFEKRIVEAYDIQHVKNLIQKNDDIILEIKKIEK